MWHPEHLVRPDGSLDGDVGGIWRVVWKEIHFVRMWAVDAVEVNCLPLVDAGRTLGSGRAISPVLWRPNGMQVNSKSPNGVTTAVFGIRMSSGSTESDGTLG